jgi:hypothetical protein
MTPGSLYRSDSQTWNDICNLQIDGVQKHMQATCKNLSPTSSRGEAADRRARSPGRGAADLPETLATAVARTLMAKPPCGSPSCGTTVL